MAGSAQLLPVLRAADLGTGAFVDSDDAGRGGGIQRGPAGLVPLGPGQQLPGFGPDQVVGGSRQRALGIEAGGGR